jgi:hypothetical protein
VARHPLITLVAAGLTPNLGASALNLTYNIKNLVGPLGPKVADLFYGWQLPVVNSILYGSALAVLVPMGLGLAHTVAKAGRREPIEPARLEKARKTSFRLTEWVTWLPFSMWIVSGIFFTLWWHIADVLPPEFEYKRVMLRFLTSQLICGLIAATSTYFMMGSVIFRVHYPLLFQLEPPDENAPQNLWRMERNGWLHFFIAVAVTPLAVVAIAVGQVFPAEKGSMTTVFAVMGVVGLVNSGVAFVLLRAMLHDAAALRAAAHSTSFGPAAPDSFTSSSLSASF